MPMVGQIRLLFQAIRWSPFHLFFVSTGIACVRPAIKLTTMTTIILGSQWGDEGKGKLTDILCQEAQICARASVSVPSYMPFLFHNSTASFL